MTTRKTDEQALETRRFWNRVARDWQIQVGEDGDRNRRMNSDPVLWRFAGEVRGLCVLDAGCGTGYLSRKLQERGARVIGIDHAEEMIRIAREKAPDLEFHVDSCSELAGVGDRAVDLVIANYVLMDTPDLEGTLKAFARVLKDGGVAVVVFSHPCFPQGRATEDAEGRAVTYHWSFSYFDRVKCVDPPWGHFTSEFIWFHRPLSEYWRAFGAAGFAIEDFEEPRVTEERYHLARDEAQLQRSRSRPCSVAFKLRKPKRQRHVGGQI